MLNYPTKLELRQLITLAMLIALQLALSKLSIPIIPGQLVVSLTFITGALIGAVGGPLYGFIAFALLDLVDSFTGGTSQFIIWWTLMEAVQGAIYGFFFYGRSLNWSSKKDWLYTSLGVGLVMLVGTFIFTPLLLKIYTGTPIIVQYIVQGRLLKIFELPIRIILTMMVGSALQKIPEWRRLINAK